MPQGVQIYADGSKYEGEWREGLKHGEGIFTWNDGRSYVGEYKNDKKHGRGTYTWTNGCEYSGQWRNGKQHGEGTYIQISKPPRYGTWKDGFVVKWHDTKTQENYRGVKRISIIQDSFNLEESLFVIKLIYTFSWCISQVSYCYFEILQITLNLF